MMSLIQSDFPDFPDPDRSISELISMLSNKLSEQETLSNSEPAC